MCAPRRSAWSHSSRSTIPAPSPITNPSRSASNGRTARSGSSLRVLIAFIVQNPARLSGVSAASLPPQIIAAASSRWIVRKASPIAWPLVAQAETTETLGPFAPVAMLTMPDAMLMMIIGTKNALTRPGPRSSNTWCCSSQVLAPPIPEPMITPTRSAFCGVIAKPASSNASRVAAIANWTNRSLRRTSLRSMYCAGSNSLISPAIWVSYGDGSNAVSRRTPERPSINPVQKASLPMPIGVMTPIPVSATRLVIVVPRCPPPVRELFRRRFDVALDILCCLTDGQDLLRLFVGDLQIKLVLQRHDQLHHVERVGSEILDELRLRRDLIRLHAELFYHFCLHAIEYRCHATITPWIVLPHHQPAVDIQDLPRDIAGFLRDEERHRRGHFFRSPGAAHRNMIDEPGTLVLPERRRQPGLNVPRGDDIGRDPATGHLLGHGLGKPDHRGLGRDVVRLPRVSDLCHDRADIDDPPAALAQHIAQRRACAVERRVQVDRQDLVPVLVPHAHEEPVARQAGVVDKDIQPSPPFPRPFDQPPAGLRRGDLRLKDRSTASRLLDQAAGTLGALTVVAVVHHDPRPFPGEPNGHRRSDPAGRSGDERNVFRQAHRTWSPARATVASLREAGSSM